MYQKNCFKKNIIFSELVLVNEPARKKTRKSGSLKQIYRKRQFFTHNIGDMYYMGPLFLGKKNNYRGKFINDDSLVLVGEGTLYIYMYMYNRIIGM